MERQRVEIGRSHAFKVTQAGWLGFDMLELMDNRRLTDVGGTSGGLGHFLMGFAMACIGGYLLTNQVSIVGSYWNFWGGNSFGITLIPMLLGFAIVRSEHEVVMGMSSFLFGVILIGAGVAAYLVNHALKPAGWTRVEVKPELAA